MRNYFKSFKRTAGFTLIELLVVIAVIGILAAVVLVAIDPIEQLARGRDSGRKSSIGQVGHALQAYYTAKASLPDLATWDADLVSSGDIKIFPAAAGGAPVATACTGGDLVNSYCYKVDATLTDFVMYTHAESKTEKTKGTCAGVAADTWYVYSSAEGQAGTVCQVAEPEVGDSFTFYP